MRALILVDLQYDFMPGGALPVRGGDRVIPVVNRLLPNFGLVVATQDWHPRNHCSFADQHEGKHPGDVVAVDGLEQVLWPVHCVQGTHGAALVEELDARRVTRIFKKGIDPRLDSYSGFYDNAHRRSTGLGEYLRDQGVEAVAVTGVATDYCVKFTVLDALALDLRVQLVADACRGVDLEEGDAERAIQEMKSAGAAIISSADALEGSSSRG